MLGMLTSNAGKGTASQQDVGRGGRKTGGRTWPWPARRHQEEDEVDQPTALDMGKTWLRRHCQPSGSKPAQATTKRTLPVLGHMQAHMQGTYLSRREGFAPTTREAEIQQLRCLSLCKGKHREA